MWHCLDFERAWQCFLGSAYISTTRRSTMTRESTCHGQLRQEMTRESTDNRIRRRQCKIWPYLDLDRKSPPSFYSQISWCNSVLVTSLFHGDSFLSRSLTITTPSRIMPTIVGNVHRLATSCSGVSTSVGHF